jgi:hypothetical protein
MKEDFLRSFKAEVNPGKRQEMQVELAVEALDLLRGIKDSVDRLVAKEDQHLQSMNATIEQFKADQRTLNLDPVQQSAPVAQQGNPHSSVPARPHYNQNQRRNGR